MDRIRDFFRDYNAVLVGNYAEHISGDQFGIIEKKIKEIEEETGLKIIITEFYVDCGLNKVKDG